MDESLCRFYYSAKFYFADFSLSKYSLASLITVPDNKRTAIKLGITIRPLNVSAMFQIRPRSIVAPMIATREYTTMKGLIAPFPNRNSIHLEPYNPHPMSRMQSSKAPQLTLPIPSFQM